MSYTTIPPWKRKFFLSHQGIYEQVVAADGVELFNVLVSVQRVQGSEQDPRLERKPEPGEDEHREGESRVAAPCANRWRGYGRAQMMLMIMTSVAGVVINSVTYLPTNDVMCYLPTYQWRHVKISDHFNRI